MIVASSWLTMRPRAERGSRPETLWADPQRTPSGLDRLAEHLGALIEDGAIIAVARASTSRVTGARAAAAAG